MVSRVSNFFFPFIFLTLRGKVWLRLWKDLMAVR
jgi:hypothetical protein